MIRIITDSTTDFTLQEAKDANIDVVPLNVIFKEKSYLDKEELDVKTFYEKLLCEDYPTTSQPSPSQFYDVFKKYENSDDEIICICISSELSGTFQSAKIASMDIKNKIEVIDARTAAMPVRIVVDKAIRMRDEGKSFDEIIVTVNDLLTRAVLYAGFDTLEFLVKGGRLSKVAGFAGTLLKIKPLIGVNDGKLEMVSKTRGFKMLVKTMMEKVLEHKIDKEYPIYLGYSKHDEGALMLKNLLEEKGYNVSKMIEIGAVIGVHAGPGACAVGFIEKYD